MPGGTPSRTTAKEDATQVALGQESAFKQCHAARERGEALPVGRSKGGDQVRGDGCGAELTPAAACPLDHRGPPAQGEGQWAGGSEGVSAITVRLIFVPITRGDFQETQVSAQLLTAIILLFLLLLLNRSSRMLTAALPFSADTSPHLVPAQALQTQKYIRFYLKDRPQSAWPQDSVLCLSLLKGVVLLTPSYRDWTLPELLI